jgi:hypothetical protein
MHIYLKYIKESIKNNRRINFKKFSIILNESQYDIVHSQPQSQSNPPPSSPGSQWVWTGSSWSNFGGSSWSWDGANGQWISAIGNYGGTTFYMNQNGEIYAQPQNWITPQSMPAPFPGSGYQYSPPGTWLNDVLGTAVQMGRPGAGVIPGSGQPGTSMGEIGHWFYLDSILESLMSGQNPFDAVTEQDIQQGSSTPFSVSARNFAFLIMLEQMFESALLSGWRYDISVSSSGNLIIRFFSSATGWITSFNQSPFLTQLLYNAGQLSAQYSTIMSNIRNIVASGGVGALTSAQLLQVFGGAAGLQGFISNLLAVGLPIAAITGMIAAIVASAYTIYSQTGTYTQENIDNLLGSLLTVITDPTTGFAQFAAAWQALFGTTAPNWFSSTSGIDWNSLPDWLREFLLNHVQPNSVPAPKPNLELLPATDILPGQQGWIPRTPTMDEISDIMNDMWSRGMQPSNGTINPGQP